MPERRKKTTVKRKAPVAAKKKTPTARKTKAAVVAKKPAAQKAASQKVRHDGKLSVYDLHGKSVDSISIDPMFHEGDVNRDIIYQVVLMYQAGQREGTAATKTRGEVSGGGKKPWKQKGTGRARHASIRSPIWTGGGTVFGPHPRDYSYTLPQTIRRKAVAEGVKDKVNNGKLFLVKGLQLEKPKTKLMVGILGAFKLEKPLVLVDKKDDNLMLASRNIYGVAVKTAEEVNALDVVSHKECLMTQDAYKGLLKRLKS
jgi:large subunit ribosomal protein L4